MVTDFGTITTNTERTRRNTMCGTILYLAPEVSAPGWFTTRPYIANQSRPPSIFGRSAACFIFSSRAVSFSREKTSLLGFGQLTARINVIESIDHFCVDLLEFPDYIPENARVRFLRFPHCVGSDSTHARY